MATTFVVQSLAACSNSMADQTSFHDRTVYAPQVPYSLSLGKNKKACCSYAR